MLGWTLGGLGLSAVAPVLLYPFVPPLTFDFIVPPPPQIASGFYPVERGGDGGAFAWTGRTFGFSFAGLDRRSPWRLTVRIAGPRLDAQQPELVTWVDGAPVARQRLPPSRFDHVVAIPARESIDVTAVTFVIDPPIHPGAADPRLIGVPVSRVELAAESWWPLYTVVVRGPVAAGGLTGALIGAFALPVPCGLAILVVAATGLGVLLTTGTAPFIAQPWTWQILAATGAAGLAWAALPRRHAAARPVVVMTFVAVVLELFALSHPDMSLGDSVFQAHRFQEVLRGHYYFTSHAPGGFEFPYAIGLYLVSAPFAMFTSDDIGNARLLQYVVVLTHGVMASLLYRLVMRWTQTAATAVLAVAACHLVPIEFNVIAIGNLTNVFGQSIAIAVLAGLGAVATARSPLWAVTMTTVIALAFLSHLSTFVMLLSPLLVAGSVLAFGPADVDRRYGRRILAVTAAAAAIAIAAYYAHFADVYRTTWQQVSASAQAGAGANGDARPWPARVLASWHGAEFRFGWPLLLLTASGAVTIARRWRASIDATVVLTWLVMAFGFALLGALTPVDFRHALAAAPAMAVLAGTGTTALWRRGQAGKMITTALWTWAVWRAVLNLVWR